MTAVEVVIAVCAIVNAVGVVFIISFVGRCMFEMQGDVKTIKGRVSSMYLTHLSNLKNYFIQREQYEEVRKIERLMKQIEEE